MLSAIAIGIGVLALLWSRRPSISAVVALLAMIAIICEPHQARRLTDWVTDPYLDQRTYLFVGLMVVAAAWVAVRPRPRPRLRELATFAAVVTIGSTLLWIQNTSAGVFELRVMTMLSAVLLQLCLAIEIVMNEPPLPPMRVVKLDEREPDRAQLGFTQR